MEFPLDPTIDSAMAQESEKKMIDLLLLAAQEIRSQGLALNEASEPEGIVLTSASLSASLSTALNLQHIVAQVESFLSALTYSSVKDRLMAVRRVSPFLDTYLQMAESMLGLQALHSKAFGKLTYILARLIISLSQNGFCKPPDDDGQQAAGDGNMEQLEGGTGFGEGTGKEDAGDEIKDESQVEGLQNEQGENNTEQKQDNEGIEMDGVDGEMQDVSDEESGSESEPEEPQSDIDDVVENLDKESSGKVDEKLWEGEHEEDKPQNDQAGSKDSESTGKDVAPQTDDTSRISKLPVEETMQDDGMPDEDNPPGAEDAPPIDAGKQLEQSVLEEAVLDLPDDIDINPSEKDDSASNVEDDLSDVDQEVDEIASQLDAQSIADDVPGDKVEDHEESETLPPQEDQNVSSVEDLAEGGMEDSNRGSQGMAPKPSLSEDASMTDDKMNAHDATDTAVDSSKENLSNGNEGLNKGYVIKFCF